MEVKEPFAKRVWKSKAFVVTFCVFAGAGIIGLINNLAKHYSVSKAIFEFLVSLVVALIFALIIYGLESLASRTKWGKK